MRAIFDPVRSERRRESSAAMNSEHTTSVVILAGGKSKRFGSPKINAKINGIEFGEIIICTLRNAGFKNFSLVGGSPTDASRWGVGNIKDQYPDSGPLGALITAMRECVTENLMVLPCDIPYIDEDSCGLLSNISDGFDLRVAKTDSPQWLCSTWRISVRELLEREFETGERAIHKVSEKLKLEFVQLPSSALINVNEPSQLKP